MAGYYVNKPKHSNCYNERPHSPGIDERPMPSTDIQQFHDALKQQIERCKKEEISQNLIPGLKAALAFYEGYFGIFKSKEGGK